MQQYLELLKKIQKEGVHKNAAREGIPGTTSLFGYQFRHNLADGFPLLTTKKMFWKGIVIELLWFLRGDTNIKYLLDNDIHIWNKDAYNYYCNHFKTVEDKLMWTIPLNEFIKQVKGTSEHHLTPIIPGYKWGDCGYQYGKIWRKWKYFDWGAEGGVTGGHVKTVDQIKNIIQALRNNPESRRHMLNSIDPAHQDDLALYWCHALSQFNCRPLSDNDKLDYLKQRELVQQVDLTSSFHSLGIQYLVNKNDLDQIPKYYLDCQMYQRSADIILGVPFNIASYALLTHILCKMCDMVPGEMIYTYGDVHIYDNHIAAANEQLEREPRQLPTIVISDEGWNRDIDDILHTIENVSNSHLSIFSIEGYDPYPKLENEAELNTGI